MCKIEIRNSRRVTPYIFILEVMRNDVLQDIFPDDGGPESIDEHPLVVKPDLALSALKSRFSRSRVFRHQFIMKPVHKSLKLRNDDVLVISWVTYYGARRIRRLTARQVARIRIAGRTGEWPTLNESIVATVEV